MRLKSLQICVSLQTLLAFKNRNLSIDFLIRRLNYTELIKIWKLHRPLDNAKSIYISGHRVASGFWDYIILLDLLEM